MSRHIIAAFVLLGLGVLLTFPPFTDFLQGKLEALAEDEATIIPSALSTLAVGPPRLNERHTRSREGFPSRSQSGPRVSP